jgi:hypothetical protein
MQPADVVNNALQLAGAEERISSFYDGSPFALAARDMWGHVRDRLFTALRPDWSVWDDALTASKTAPPYYDEQTPWTQAYPDLPWRYEYPLPALCLVPLAIKPRPAYVPVWRPRAMRFQVRAAGGVYSLLGDNPSPILTCVHSVHDTELWADDFTAAMVDALSKRIARPAPVERRPTGSGAAAEPDGQGGARARG